MHLCKQMLIFDLYLKLSPNQLNCKQLRCIPFIPQGFQKKRRRQKRLSKYQISCKMWIFWHFLHFLKCLWLFLYHWLETQHISLPFNLVRVQHMRKRKNPVPSGYTRYKQQHTCSNMGLFWSRTFPIMYSTFV